MRPLYVVHLAAPAPERERSASNDFEADAATAVIILFCALICGLALKAATRCFVLLGGGCLDDLPHARHQGGGDSKPDGEAEAGRLVAAEAVAYTAGGMGLAAECAICLSEFEEGEGVQVLTRCNHGFHVDCVGKWLCSHSSCPTCRCSCLADVDPTPEVDGAGHQRS